MEYINDLTSEIPTRDCPMGKPVVFLANVRCSESERRAREEKIHDTIEKDLQWLCSKYRALTLHTPQATVHSSLVADAWFAWHSMQRSIMWLRQIAQLSTTISKR
ncbi:hypothetical protein X777_11495 [Ooceraea biroi]|uniref:Uncharacterized protein n=1 Tax=Ooceraea biroi TaxID=2015173 RepID=A0A026W342_OOCBI|nr:hypothetical protein X777_11495 [Ooceraea biroi]